MENQPVYSVHSDQKERNRPGMRDVPTERDTHGVLNGDIKRNNGPAVGLTFTGLVRL